MPKKNAGSAASEIGAPIDIRAPRTRLIEAASQLFCRYGINATGVDAVIAQAGTAKTTLYKLFGSKEGLVEAVLEQEGRLWREWFLQRVEHGAETGRDRVARIFPVLKEWFAEERFFGCPFINAIGEHDKSEDRLRDITIQHKKQVLGRIESWAADAGAKDPAAFAHQVGVLMDGAIVAAMVTRDPGVADHAAAAASALLQAAA
jgi:AcrR family transcriptional regulator